MRRIKKFLYFLGSVNFAIFLILLLAIFVIVGTVIESKTGSHKAASRLVYANPLFLVLLWCFFINIFMATLNRWPFQKKHIPFIITHIGLLMVIGGTLLKISFGTQGTLTLKEGMTSNKLTLDNKALWIKRKSHVHWQPITLTKNYSDELKSFFQTDDLSIGLKGYAPHGKERFKSWIKGDYLTLIGHPPIKINEPYKINGRMVIAAFDPEAIREHLSELPSLIFLHDKTQGITQAVALNSDGEVSHKEFKEDSLQSIYAYDEGRHGYSISLAVNDQETEFETPLKREFTPLPSPAKEEEETPLLALSFKSAEGMEDLSLAYLSPLPTPVFDGEWLVKYSPYQITMPYEVRVRKATTTFYDQTDQPQNYSAELYINGEKASLSMNQVWESKDGWRFYLANLSPLDESRVKQVRLVVNHDPFKWWLTYPGGIILALGIILLYRNATQRKKSKNTSTTPY